MPFDANDNNVKAGTPIIRKSLLYRKINAFALRERKTYLLTPSTEYLPTRTRTSIRIFPGIIFHLSSRDTMSSEALRSVIAVIALEMTAVITFLIFRFIQSKLIFLSKQPAVLENQFSTYLRCLRVEKRTSYLCSPGPWRYSELSHVISLHVRRMIGLCEAV